MTQQESNLLQSFSTQLRALYALQVSMEPDEYLEAHSRNLAVIRRDTSIFLRYMRLLPRTGAVLDWGCNHAPTACMVKMLRGDALQIYGCDVHAPGFRAFHDFAGLRYTQLTHPYLLPYESDFFDAVIATAALEHAADDGESLKELYRVIKPGGFLLVTTLPNRYSYTEWLCRRLGRSRHLRLYSLKQARQMFLHHGFVPVASGYHQVFPSLVSAGGFLNSSVGNKVADVLASQNELAEGVWPIRCFASNLFLVGKKVRVFVNTDFNLLQQLRETAENGCALRTAPASDSELATNMPKR